jgi:pimeloyl-ACP methyl ester carboxylesterase
VVGEQSNDWKGERVVLVHGWLGSQAVWMKTAHWLHDHHGCSVLLLDLYGFGGKSSDRVSEVFSAPLYMRQLRECITHVGWDNHPITLAGKSLGAAVSMHYVFNFPDHVRKLVLVCPSGSSEPNPFMGSRVGRFLSRLFLLEHKILKPLKMFLAFLLAWIIPCLKRTFWIRYAYCHVHLLTNTPDYNIPDDFPQKLSTLANNGQVSVIVLQGLKDWLHVQPARRIKLIARESNNIHVIEFPDKDHIELCDACMDWDVSFLPNSVWELQDEEKGRLNMSSEKS